MKSVTGKFVTHVLPAIVRPMRILWNEVIGFFFLAIAAWTIPSTVRSIREFDGDAESLFRIGLSLFFGLMMAGFGIMSFLRARRISRS